MNNFAETKDIVQNGVQIRVSHQVPLLSHTKRTRVVVVVVGGAWATDLCTLAWSNHQAETKKRLWAIWSLTEASKHKCVRVALMRLHEMFSHFYNRDLTSVGTFQTKSVSPRLAMVLSKVI